MTTRGVVFDLDGTLVDSLRDLHESLGDVLAARGLRRPSPDEVRSMVGDGARSLVDRALAATGGPRDAPGVDDVTRAFLATYGPRAAVHTAPFDGMIDVVDAFVARGLKLAVCTNKPRAATLAILEATGLASRFQVVVAGDDVPLRKPDPVHVLATCLALGLPASEVAMIGDGPHDLLAAAGAGARPIGVRWGYGDVDSVPSEFVANTPSDLLSVV